MNNWIIALDFAIDAFQLGVTVWLIVGHLRLRKEHHAIWYWMARVSPLARERDLVADVLDHKRN